MKPCLHVLAFEAIFEENCFSGVKISLLGNWMGNGTNFPAKRTHDHHHVCTHGAENTEVIAAAASLLDFTRGWRLHDDAHIIF